MFINIAHKTGLFLLLFPAISLAEWNVITHTDINNDTKTQVAYTRNDAGYSLEIYRDNVGAIRSRFSLNSTLDKFTKHNCPTYEIDARFIDNRSINDAPCLTDLGWSEFVLGYVNNNSVSSGRLNSLMNGRTIVFRFMLENGTYQETEFSLAGSKRTTLAVIGTDVTISP